MNPITIFIHKNKIRRRTDGVFEIRAKVIGYFLAAVLLFGSLLAIGRVVFIKGDEYRKAANSIQLADTELVGVRGNIYDANMTPLVTGVESWFIYLDAEQLNKSYGIFDKGTEYKKEMCRYMAKEIIRIVKAEGQLTELVYDTEDELYEAIYNYTGNHLKLVRKITPTIKNSLDTFLNQSYPYKVVEELDKRGNAVLDENGDPKTYKVYESYSNRPGLFLRYQGDVLRIYSHDSLGAAVLGVVNEEKGAQSGLEYYYDNELQGEAGRIVTAKDAKDNPVESSFKAIYEAKDGNSLVTTIDRNIQFYLESALENTFKSTKADSVYGMVMDVNTGAILAMGEKPGFDLTNPTKISVDADLSGFEELEPGSDEFNALESKLISQQRVSDCVNTIYEPGSTFKIFTAAAAIEEGVANLNTTYNCNSRYPMPGHTYDCANFKAHGTQTLSKMLMNSCNCGFIWLGQQMGIERYMKYFEAFGFSEKTGIDMSGETGPIVHYADSMTLLNLASTSFGQSFKITPVQLLAATSAIANGGKLMKPYFVKKIIDSQGNIVTENEPTVVRNVISKSTADLVTSMMVDVVEKGTGTSAHIDGYLVAGKTGTAEKLDREKKYDENGKEIPQKMIYVASFVCFAPADDPQVAILICVDNAKSGGYSGGALAAPAAKLVLTSTLDYLGIEPEYTENQLKKISGTAPDLRGKDVHQARSAAAAKGFSTTVSGNGTNVISQVPAAGQLIPSGGVIVLYTEENAEIMEVEVPDFTGLSTSQVNSLAISKGINVVFSTPSDTAGIEAYSQNVSAGTVVEAGTKITVYFRKTNVAQD